MRCGSMNVPKNVSHWCSEMPHYDHQCYCSQSALCGLFIVCGLAAAATFLASLLVQLLF